MEEENVMEEGEEEENGNDSNSTLEEHEEEEEEGECNYNSNSTSEEEQGEPEPKKLKLLQEEDVISTLPDSIIHHILSLLPMEDAVTQDWGFVEKWLRFATLGKVEELHIDLLYDRQDESEEERGFVPYVMPHFLYENSSLTKLDSRYCSYNPKGPVSWTSLKALTISDASFEEEVLQWILLGCPILEYLELRSCRSICKINASSNPRLKKLVLSDVIGAYEVSIRSVNSLEILGEEYEYCLTTLLDVSSLVDATLDFGELDFWPGYENQHMSQEYQDMVVHVLEKVNHVNQLTLGSVCIQVLSLLELKGLPPPLSNHERNCLTIATGFNNRDLYGVASLLNSLPNLEKLIIKLTLHDKYYSFYSEELEKLDKKKMEHFWEVKGRSFECLVMSLKTVEIVVKSRYWIEFDEHHRQYYIATKHPGLIEFVEFILKSARVLERMVFVAEKSSGLEAHDFYWLAKKVLNLPRASPNAVVLLPD
ncbi:F-box/LRR-repeat protein [Corchorus capsularis]|uniref:F-box/LRR-repeat protein n=1 Tax=Corchorus capsularis TaxID=210143 RepID=A0A1R3JAU5_COCAP|nr:F-box/LRR-repeat protein [Corchorus capsularis]